MLTYVQKVTDTEKIDLLTAKLQTIYSTVLESKVQAIVRKAGGFLLSKGFNINKAYM